MQRGWSALVCLLGVLSAAAGHKTGAPPEACSAMVPGHGVEPQASPLPYAVRPSRQVVSPGETITLEIGRASADAVMLRGLFVQVRNASNPAASPAIGTFLAADQTRIIDCPPGKQNAVTHVDGGAKERVQLRWRVPADLADGEQLVFRTSLVSEFRQFWAAHDSAPIRVARAVDEEPETTPEPERDVEDPHPEPEAEPHDHAHAADSHRGKGAAGQAAPAAVFTVLSVALLNKVV